MIEFNQEKHEYKLNGVVTPSVTHILREVFGFKYGNVKLETLERARAKGSAVHEEIDKYIKTGELGFSEEFLAFKEEYDSLEFQALENEFYVSYEGPNGNFCGTVDLFLTDGVLVDFKTSRTLDKLGTTRQLNMYRRALIALGYKVKRLEAWHIVGDQLKRVELDIYPDEWTDKVLEYYYAGKTAESDDELLGETVLPKDADVEKACDELKAIDKAMEELQVKRDKITNNLKSYFELKNMDGYERKDMTLSFIPSATRTSFDSARFKKEMGEAEFSKWTKTSTTSPILRIKYK